MKKINVSYDVTGHIENVTDCCLHFEQENSSLQVDASIATDKKVRAYIKAPNNNSKVTDELISNEDLYSIVIDGEYMSKGTLYIGYELYDDTGYIERLEPLKIYIDSFVSLGTGSSDNVYVVTITVGNVETVSFEESASVKNVGTKKDMVLDFKIPRGETGLKGDKGDKGEKGDTGAQGIQGIQGVRGEKGDDGYTPIKGVDYFTEEDIKSLGIDDKVDKTEFDILSEDVIFLQGIKVDKEEGKGLSTNDFTNYLKKKVENNTFDYYYELEYAEQTDLEELLNTCTVDGLYHIHFHIGDDAYGTHYILSVSTYGIYSDSDVEYVQYQSLFDLARGEFKIRDGIDSEWQKVSVSQTDLAKAIGDVETSFENIIQKYGLGGDAQ